MLAEGKVEALGMERTQKFSADVLLCGRCVTQRENQQIALVRIRLELPQDIW
jgi:hypothetical protein